MTNFDAPHPMALQAVNAQGAAAAAHRFPVGDAAVTADAAAATSGASASAGSGASASAVDAYVEDTLPDLPAELEPYSASFFTNPYPGTDFIGLGYDLAYGNPSGR